MRTLKDKIESFLEGCFGGLFLRTSRNKIRGCSVVKSGIVLGQRLWIVVGEGVDLEIRVRKSS